MTNAHRVRGKLPEDALVIRPISRGLMSNRGRSLGWRVGGAVTGLVGVVVAVLLARLDLQTGLAAVLIVPAVAAVGVVALFQPGMYLYAHDDAVGLRTVFGSRYEVRDGEVRRLRVGQVAFWGVMADGVSFEAAEGHALLTHGNVHYDDRELAELARRIGAELVEQ